LLRQLITIFLTDSLRTLAQIQKAIHVKDFDAIRKTAHVFRGSVSIFAAPAALRSATELENLASEGNMVSVKKAFAALKNETTSLRKKLSSLRSAYGRN